MKQVMLSPKTYNSNALQHLLFQKANYMIL
jgi:hypothetical protein